MMEFKGESIVAINPGPDDYRRAGSMAGSRAADRYLAYCFSQPRKAARNGVRAALHYHTMAMDAACDRMRAKGATEQSLEIWCDGYAQALKSGLEIFAPKP